MIHFMVLYVFLLCKKKYCIAGFLPTAEMFPKVLILVTIFIFFYLFHLHFFDTSKKRKGRILGCVQSYRYEVRGIYVKTDLRTLQ